MQTISQAPTALHLSASAPKPGVNWFRITALILSVVIALLILVPLGRVVLSVFVFYPPGTSPLAEIQAQRGLVSVIVNTFIVIGSAAIVAVFFGSLLAWLNERTDVGMTSVSKILPIVPLLLPPIAGSIGWVMLASDRAGFLNVGGKKLLAMLGIHFDGPIFSIFSWSGVVFVYVIYTLPQIYLCVSAALRNLDPSLEEASRVSGAGPLRTLFTITLPAVLPAIISGGTIAIIFGISLFSVPAIIASQAGIDILSVRIVNLMMAEFPAKTSVALALGLVLVVVIGTMTWLQRRVIRSGKFATIGGKGSRATPVRLGWLRWPARVLMVGYILIATVIPFVTLVFVSFQSFWSANIDLKAMTIRHYVNVFGRSFTSQGIMNSMILATLCATVVMLIAAVIAFYIDMNREKRVSSFMEFTLKLPAAVSNLIIGIAFIVMFAGAPFYLHGTVAILFLAYLILYMPQASIVAASSVAQVGRQLAEASSISGASHGGTFMRIMMPLMMPGMMAGWIMLFVLFAGDLTASAMLSGTGNPVIGSVILNLWTEGSFAPVAAFASVVTVVMSSVVLSAIWLSKKLAGGYAPAGGA